MKMKNIVNEELQPRDHPRTIGWFGTTAVALGGSNLSVLILAALFVGQGTIPGQGSAAVVLLIVGVLLAWAAAPGWTELVLMFPNRVGGISASCAEAFRPYNPMLANLTGFCYWSAWAPVTAINALIAATALHSLYLPGFSEQLLAACFIVFFTIVSLSGVKWVVRLTVPVAIVSSGLAFISGIMPVFSGGVDWQQAFTFHLTVPFPGWFGGVTSVMAGLYLVGYCSLAFEQATSHVGETIDPNRNVPRAVFASAAAAGFYFIVLPIVWLGTLGPEEMAKDLALVLGPTFAPLLGGAAKAAATWFIVLNMFHGVIATLSGPSRTLAQLAEDGLLPEFFARRSRTDVPWIATLVTAGVGIVYLYTGVPLWLIAATNFTYLISIALVSVAVWLLRRDQPDLPRPYRAPRGTIVLGLCAAGVWILTSVLGFQQFGLPTVVVGIAFAYSGVVLYAWRKAADRRKLGLPLVAGSLHLKLTGAMLLVLAFDATGYLVAVAHVPSQETALNAILADIFVTVALLTIGVGLILPGMIANAAVQVSAAADHLVQGTLADFTRAMHALAAGDLNAAKAHFDFTPVAVRSRDEIGAMAQSFNKLQEEIGHAAVGLEGARMGLSEARDHLELRVEERTTDLSNANSALTTAHQELKAGEHRLRVILETQPECVKQVAADGTLLAMNAAGLRLIEADHPDEALGGNVYDLIAPEYRTMFRELNEAIFRGESKTAEFEIIGLKSTRRWMATHACPLRDLEGNIVAQLAVTRDVSARKRSEAELREAQKQLLDVSRQAGMAEVATGVLHNVGNVLNSANVSLEVASGKVRGLKAGSLEKVAGLLHEHAGDLPSFFASHPQGARLPAFLTQIAAHLSEQQASVLRELEALRSNVDHINEIVSMQQRYAGSGGVIEMLPIADILEDALRMNDSSLGRHGARVEREIAPSLPALPIDRHKVLQILVNLIRNATHAMDVETVGNRCLTLRANVNGDRRVCISVSDTGIGISPENLPRVFEHGFTTKKTGHGFGLHSSAQSAVDMGGSLCAHSDGPGRGATFTLELPAQPQNV